MWTIIIVIILLLLLGIVIKNLNKDYYILALCKRVKTVDGSRLNDKVFTIPGTTIFGNNFDLLKMNPATIFQYLRTNNQLTNGKSYSMHFLFAVVYNVVSAEDAEEVLQSQALIKKGIMYNLMHPFLGEGLLTSTDQKWHSQRKVLTPAFHFNILQTFIEIFKEGSYKFVNILNTKVNQIVELADIIQQFTLNNVCETALGIKLDEMPGSEEYCQSIHNIELSLVKRMSNPLMYYNIVFYLFGDYKEQQKNLKVAHDFSSKIIRKKREAFRERMQAGVDEIVDEFGKKKRYAMLDTLFDAEVKNLIDHQGICDEVNTFMYAGYDTTSTCLVYALLNLSLHQDIQEKCYLEIQNLGDMAELTVFDFNQLEYLECVIKETLRLYPSVPFIGRQCVSEAEVNGLILPAKTQINLHLIDIMRDPKHFTEPLVFDPTRFLPKNSNNRHPFAFIPFSAGPRNCIGQKFAMLEIKVLLVAIIKDFVLVPVTRSEDLVFENGIVLRTQQKVQIKFDKRPSTAV